VAFLDNHKLPEKKGDSDIEHIGEKVILTLSSSLVRRVRDVQDGIGDGHKN
jgi:hypothetical protein